MNIQSSSFHNKKNKGGKELVYVDAMLGDVAKWLRFFGVKVVYWKGSDDALLNVPTLLTSDKELCRRAKNCIYIKGKKEEKIAKALIHLNVNINKRTLHCMRCGTKLKRVDSFNSAIPDKVKKYHKTAFFCSECNKYYWKGRHWKNMKMFLKRIKKEYYKLKHQTFNFSTNDDSSLNEKGTTPKK